MKSIDGRREPRQTVRIVLITLGLVAVLSGAVGGYLYLTRPAPAAVLAADIQSKLTFSPFMPSAGSKEFAAGSYKLSNAEDGTQILSYVITTSDGAKITVSEYTQPPQFGDIPEYKNQFLNNVAKQYDSVQTASGTIYLGRLTKQNNQQVGIMLEKGLLVFMTPSEELVQAQWHKLGDQLLIPQTDN